MASILRYFNELRTWSVIAIADVFSDTQSANQIFAGPATGAAAAPTFRTLVAADVPAVTPPGMVLLNTLSGSNVATLPDTTSITATYDEYIFIYRNMVPITNNAFLLMQVSEDGGANWKTATYDSMITGALIAGTASTTDTTGGGILLSGTNVNFDGVSNNTSYGCSGQVSLHAPASSSMRKQCTGSSVWFSGGVARREVGTVGGYFDGDNGAINAVRFVYNTGNITGSVKVYGIKTS